MKISNINMSIYSNNYKTNENSLNKNNMNESKENTKDTCEISSLGRSLNKIIIEDVKLGVSAEELEKIKSKVLEGTYKVDSKTLAEAILTSMKGGQ
ncbi:flagellar biosynthesis anti-sigma factor FlgM [Clostridium sp. UBA1056]|uniref:flagellar biosynthesis anti-sigma factor FlgM n=1 Tax=unclassified Clostridium TaxID=2614128 RepID=UPI0032170843